MRSTLLLSALSLVLVAAGGAATPEEETEIANSAATGGATAKLDKGVYTAGQTMTLTVTEYKLLHYLLANARRVLTRDQILAQVWDYTFSGNASVLETYISYLRQKVDCVEPPLIHTVRGVGYTLRLPPELEHA